MQAGAAAALAAVFAGAEQHLSGNGAAALRDQQAAALALGELVQDHGLQALESMMNKATGYLLHQAEGRWVVRLSPCAARSLPDSPLLHACSSL